MYPRLVVDLKKIKHNTEIIVNKYRDKNISIMGVTKVFCAIQEVVDAMIDGGIDFIADSRIQNLKKVKTNLPKVLLRCPMLSEVEEVVKYADIVLISELVTIKRINTEASKLNKNIKLILMFDMGDLREGLWFENSLDFIDDIKTLSNVTIYGIGTNLTCYGGIMPNEENLGKLVVIKDAIEEKGVKLDIVSGGNSSSLYLDELSGINNLRIGEAIALGRETAYGNIIDSAYEDAFYLEAEVVEVANKPSYPVGQIGMDAFGNVPTFIDKGIIPRAILAIGKQDVDETGIYPEKGQILGASSDHLIMEGEFKLGDIVKFNLSYGALLRLATSEYVTKEIEND
ncbi:alanine/ornithine racemase family PLP-dependent enzyme [Mycoplasmatota bacterium WC44]